ITSMKQVAQLGTFLMPDWRRRGVGRLLFRTTEEFAQAAGYAKIVIQVRASNEPAKAFYRRLGLSCVWAFSSASTACWRGGCRAKDSSPIFNHNSPPLAAHAGIASDDNPGRNKKRQA